MGWGTKCLLSVSCPQHTPLQCQSPAEVRVLGDVGLRVPREGQHCGLQKKVNLLSDSRFVRGLLKGLLLNATVKLGKNQVISEKICVVVLFCFIVLLLLQIILCIPLTPCSLLAGLAQHTCMVLGRTHCMSHSRFP